MECPFLNGKTISADFPTGARTPHLHFAIQHSVLDIGCWILDVGCSMFDVRCSMFPLCFALNTRHLRRAPVPSCVVRTNE